MGNVKPTQHGFFRRNPNAKEHSQATDGMATGHTRIPGNEENREAALRVKRRSRRYYPNSFTELRRRVAACALIVPCRVSDSPDSFKRFRRKKSISPNDEIDAHDDQIELPFPQLYANCQRLKEPGMPARPRRINGETI